MRSINQRHSAEQSTTNLAQRKAGLDFMQIVRWQEVQVEVLEGFGEVTKVPEDILWC